MIRRFFIRLQIAKGLRAMRAEMGIPNPPPPAVALTLFAFAIVLAVTTGVWK